MENYKDLLHHFVCEKIIRSSDEKEYLKQIEKSKLSVQDFLIQNRVASEDTVYKTLAKFYEVPYARFDILEVDQSLIELFGLNFMRKHKVVPIKICENNTLIVATSNVQDILNLQAIKLKHLGNVSYLLVSPKQINEYLNSLLASRSTSSAVNDMKSNIKGTSIKLDAGADDEKEDAINAPAVRLVDSVIKEAISLKASDIHIEPYEDKVCVRYRIDGDLLSKITFEKSNYASVVARLKIISGMNIAERRIPQDGRINMQINGAEYDFRLSTLPTVHGEKFVIRVLDKSSFSLTRADLGFREDANELIDKIVANPHGLVLLTGPTGCGKSTTLYCFLKEVNKANVNIVTVEDPVEYSMDGINQIQVNPKADLTFATTLRSILRQDPDIIMVGEIRDEETAHMAIRGAITGHLVFSTLHTNDSTGAVSRLVDMGVNSYLVADALVGVISQRLVKCLCPMCKEKHKTTLNEMGLLGIDKPQFIYKPKGCKYCNGTGYKGRFAVHEILQINDKIRYAINRNLPAEELRQVAKENGLMELITSCQKSVLDGQTSIEELVSLSVDGE